MSAGGWKECKIKWRDNIQQSCVNGWILMIGSERIEIEAESHHEFFISQELKLGRHILKSELLAGAHQDLFVLF